MSNNNIFTSLISQQQQQAVASAKPSSQYLVEFRAGKLNRAHGNWVHPDPRIGLVYLNVEDDGLLHFYWKDRSTNKVEDDLIIFPSEAKFIQVEQSSERVYMLAFQSSSQKHFFWIQEPTDKNDLELVILVNKAIHDPAALQQQLQLNNHSVSPSAVSEQAQLIQLLQQMGSEGGPAAQNANRMDTTTSSISDPQMQQLAGILSGIQVPQGESDVELSHILTVEQLGPVLRDAKASQALFPHLPAEAPQTAAELEDTIRSPQFKQAMQTLSYALRSGQLATILTSMGLDADGGGSGVQALIEAIVARQSSSSTNSSSLHPSNSNEDDHEMDTS